jgi:hypothetical protein
MGNGFTSFPIYHSSYHSTLYSPCYYQHYYTNNNSDGSVDKNINYRFSVTNLLYYWEVCMTYDGKQFYKKAKANNLKSTKVTDAASPLILQNKVVSALCYYNINKRSCVRLCFQRMATRQMLVHTFPYDPTPCILPQPNKYYFPQSPLFHFCFLFLLCNTCSKIKLILQRRH